MNKSKLGLLLAVCLVFGISTFAYGQGADPKAVSIVQPDSGAIKGIGYQVIVEGTAWVTADDIMCDLIDDSNNVIIADASQDSVHKINTNGTIWRWYYTIKAGDPRKLVKASIKFHYPDGGVSASDKKSVKKFTIDGERPINTTYIEAVAIDKNGEQLKIGDKIKITVTVKSGAINDILNNVITDVKAFFSAPGNPLASGGFSVSLGTGFDASRNIVKEITIAEGNFGDLAHYSAYGYVLDNAGNLSSINANDAAPSGVESPTAVYIDAKRPYLGVAGKIDATVPDSTLWPGAGGKFTDEEKKFKYSVSEQCDSVVVTFTGSSYKYVALNVMPPAGGGWEVAGTSFKDGATEMPEGTYSYTVWAKDVAGNTSAVVVDNVYYDNSNPQFVELFPQSVAVGGEAGTDTINAATAIVTFTLSEMVDTLSVTYFGLAGPHKDTTRVVGLADASGDQAVPVAGLADSTKYNLALWARDPAGNTTALNAGDMWYILAFAEPLITHFEVRLAAGENDSAIVSNPITIEVVALDDLDRRAVTFAGDVSAMANGAQRFSWTNGNVVDNGDGTAILSATGWFGGKFTVDVTDTAHVEKVTIDASYDSNAGSLDSLAWLAGAYSALRVEGPFSSAAKGEIGVPLPFMVTPTDEFDNPSLRQYNCIYSPVNDRTAIRFSSNSGVVSLPIGGQELTVAGAAFDIVPITLGSATVTVRGVAYSGIIATPFDIIVEVMPPAPPANVMGEDIPNDHGSAILLSWDPSPGPVSYYSIYRDVTVDSRVEVAKWGVVLPDLPDGMDRMNAIVPTLGLMGPTTYYVAAVKGSVPSGLEGFPMPKKIGDVLASAMIPNATIDPVSSELVASAEPILAVDNIPPAAAEKLYAFDNPADEGGMVLLNWTDSPDDKVVSWVDFNGQKVAIPGVKEYAFYRKDRGAADNTYVLVGKVAGGATQFVDETAQGGKWYTYQIRALDASNEVITQITNNGFAMVNDALSGDFNSDGLVWLEDFSMFGAAFGMSSDLEQYPEWEPAFDLNGDDLIWLEDFSIFGAQFGTVRGAAKRVPVAYDGANNGVQLASDAARNGSILNYDLLVSGAPALSGYVMTVRYDPTALRLDGSFGDNGVMDSPLYLTKKVKEGELLVACVTKGGVPVVNADGLVSSIRFEIVGSIERSSVKVESAELVDGQSKLNMVEKLANTELTFLPSQFALSQNYPNPFNMETMLSYDVAKDANVSLVVYNILGQEVRTLVNEAKVAGTYTLRWDGRDNVGRDVAAGVYFYRLNAGSHEFIKKMVLLK